MKEFRNPQNVHAPPGGYSHQVELTGSERMLILSTENFRSRKTSEVIAV